MSSSLNSSASVIHERALGVARKYRACEVELIEVLQEVDRHRVYLQHGCNSLFKYVTALLGLSEEVAYVFINVARKAHEVPALRHELEQGTITITKAKKIASVITRENQSHWLELAKSKSKRELEKQVALHAPLKAIPDKLSYSAEPTDKVSIREARVQLQVGVSEDVMLKLRHAQDLISQRKQASVGLEEVLSILLESYIRKEDPVEKAKRSKIKGRHSGQSGAKNFSHSKGHAGLTHTQATKSLGMDKSRPTEKSNSEMSTQTVESRAASTTQQLRKLVPGPVQKMPASNSTLATRKLFMTRRPFTAKQKHEVFLKYKGQCTFELNGRRCGQRRFLQIHHKRPVAHGGTNEIENLELLCSGHHKVRHFTETEPH